MSHPTAQKALFRFPLLVRPNAFGRHFIDMRVAARQGGGHAANRHRATFEANRHEAPEYRGEKVGGFNVNAKAVRPDRVGIRHHIFKNTSFKIPPRRVESRRVGPQRIQHLFHLTRES